MDQKGNQVNPSEGARGSHDSSSCQGDRGAQRVCSSSGPDSSVGSAKEAADHHKVSDAPGTSRTPSMVAAFPGHWSHLKDEEQT